MKIQNPFALAFVATLGVGLGILAIQSVQTLATVLLYIGTALFLSLGLEPVVGFLERRGLRRAIAVLITILTVVALFAGVVWMIVPIIIDQVAQLVVTITAYLQRNTIVTDLPQWLHSLFPAIELSAIQDALEAAQTWLLQNWGLITGGVIDAGLAFFGGVTGAFIVLILTIYFTASTPALKQALASLVPASKRERFNDLANQITASVGYYVMGQFSLGVLNGVLSAIFLSIIQAPFPAVLAVIAFMGSLVPLVGTLTSSAIIVLTCLIPGLGSPTTALIAGIYYLIYMQVEAYIINPRIMSRAVSVPGAIVVIAALAGGSLLGLLGALVAIPVAASALIIYRQVLIPRQNAR